VFRPRPGGFHREEAEEKNGIKKALNREIGEIGEVF